MAVKKKKAAVKKKKTTVTETRGRKPFAINEKNAEDVVRYLERKIAREHMSDNWEDDYNMSTIMSFKTPEQITEWCAKHVKGRDWTRLVRAIQKSEERNNLKKKSQTRSIRNKKHTITLHWEALEFLQMIKDEHGPDHSRDAGVETLSDAVFFLKALYEKAQSRGVALPTRKEWEQHVMKR